jgi:hypothetical protein
MSAVVVTGGGAARTRLHLGTTAHNDITAPAEPKEVNGT